MSPILMIAWRNLRKNWRHSLASMLSITAGFMAVCLFQGFIADARDVFAEGITQMGMLGHVVVQKKGAGVGFKEDPWKYSLRAQDQAVIDAFLQKEGASVASRVRFLHMVGMMSNGRISTVFLGYGYDVNDGVRLRGPVWAWNAVAGKPLHLSESPDGILVASTLGTLLDCNRTTDEPVSGPITGYVAKERAFECFRDTVQLQASTENSQLNALDAQIVGLSDSGMRELDDKFTVMPLALAQQLLGTDALTMYSIQLANPHESPAFIQRLEAAAQVGGVDLEILPWQKHATAELYRRSIELLSMFQFFVLAVVIVIAAMSVVNTLTKSVAERTREIGTLRSMGYLRRHIVTLFAYEGFFLALVACGLGVVLTVLVTVLLNWVGLVYPPGIASYTMPLTIRLVPVAYVFAALGLCLLSTLAALLPARRAAHKNIPDALGHV